MALISVIEVLGTDLTVVNSARVSFDKHKDEIDNKDISLLKFLLRHNHWTPFSHPQIQLRLKMPIFVARQWFKHQMGFTRNEMSRRYVTQEPEFYLPEILRQGAEDKKQGSSDEAVEHNSELLTLLDGRCNSLKAVYNYLIEEGVCAEQARMILPQNTYTEFYETGSLAAYLRLISLRNKPDAQKEIKEYATTIEQILTKYFPETLKAAQEVNAG